MVSNWVKINGELFNIKNIGAQWNITHQNISWKNVNSYASGRSSCDITIIFNHSDSSKIFQIFENREKFNMVNSEMVADGCYIKTIDMDPINMSLTVDITSDYVKLKDLSDIRDEKINQILDKTSDKNDNIN